MRASLISENVRDGLIQDHYLTDQETDSKGLHILLVAAWLVAGRGSSSHTGPLGTLKITDKPSNCARG